MNDVWAEEPDAAGPNSPLAKWESASSIPMLALSVGWIVLITMWVLRQPNNPENLVILWLLIAVWVVFVIDYVVRLVLAEHKKKFLRESLLDLGSVLIPILRPFHLLTYLKAIPYLRRPTTSSFRLRVAVMGVSWATLFIYTIALSVFEVERFAPDGNIDSLGNSLWWAMVTITTVGYGDYFPVTIPGRVLAVILMMGGIAIVGATSAFIISVLNERMQAMTKRHSSRVHAESGSNSVGPSDSDTQ